MVFLMQGGGNVGSAVAQSHLRSILVSIGAIVMGQPEVYFLFKPNAIDGQGEIADESSRAFLKGYLDSFARWIEVTRQFT